MNISATGTFLASIATTLAGPALGQGVPPAQSKPQPAAPPTLSSQPPDSLRLIQLIGAIVSGADSAPVGLVNDIVFDPSGKVRAIVIGIAGSRGLGDKDVAVAPDALKIEPPLGGTRQTLDRSPTDFAQPGSTSVASSLRQADLAAAPD